MQRLLASVDAGRLVILCGAGLSMAPPSSLPSAKVVAEMCFDRYTESICPGADVSLRGDLEAFAEHFAQRTQLESIFMDTLVPWQAFARAPNPGHAAVADFLITRAAAGALSTNYDTLIERRGMDYGADFRGSLEGDMANRGVAAHSPLLKFHGCSLIDRHNTVWTKSQLARPPIRERIASCRTWMAANLRAKDLLVLGFWSDWPYFNSLLADAFLDVAPLSITVVDPSPTTALETKAPELWSTVHQDNVTFNHVQDSAADVLDELRRAFSRGYLRRVLRAGVAAVEAEIGSPCDPTWIEPPDLDSEALYALRRDAEGVPSTAPAKLKAPEHCEQLGLFQLLLRRAGAVATPDGYLLGTLVVRAVSGAGRILSTLEAQFSEPPAPRAADLVVAVGAVDLVVPGNVIRGGTPGSIVRPAPSSRWLDSASARQLLGI